MATLRDKIQDIKNSTGYIAGSFIIKSADDDGLVAKWLEENADPGDGTANRKQRFMQLKKSEAKTILQYRKRTVLYTIDVNDPQ